VARYVGADGPNRPTTQEGVETDADLQHRNRKGRSASSAVAHDGSAPVHGRGVKEQGTARRVLKKAIRGNKKNRPIIQNRPDLLSKGKVIKCNAGPKEKENAQKSTGGRRTRPGRGQKNAQNEMDV